TGCRPGPTPSVRMASRSVRRRGTARYAPSRCAKPSPLLCARCRCVRPDPSPSSKSAVHSMWTRSLHTPFCSTGARGATPARRGPTRVAVAGFLVEVYMLLHRLVSIAGMALALAGCAATGGTDSAPDTAAYFDRFTYEGRAQETAVADATQYR